MTINYSLKNANKLLQAGKLDDAQKEYQKLIELKPDFAWNYYYLGQLFAKQEKWQDAVTQYRQATKLNPNSAHLHNSLAEALIQQGELDEAINSLQKAIFIEPDRAIFYQTLALAYEARSDFCQAFKTWEKILSLDPSHWRATQKVCWLQTNIAENFIRQGDKLNKEGKIEESVECYQQGLIVNCQQPMLVYRTCGNNLITLGKFKEAERVFQQLIEVYPELPDGYEGYAKLTHSLGDWELALKRWSEAIFKFPENIAFQLQKGNVLIKLSRFDEAEAVFQQLIEKYPNQPYAYKGYARLTHSLGDWELALKRWSEAIFKFPDNIDFQVQKGNVLIKLSRFGEAEAVFQQLIEKYPNQPHGYEGYAMLTHNLGDWEIALKRWDNAISKLPNYLNFLVQKGNALIELCRFDEADTVFQEIIQKYPRHYHGYFGYGQVSNTLRDWKLALERWENAIAKLPDYFNFYLQKGDVLAIFLKYEEAETWWEKVIALYPERHEGLCKSAVLARQLGNREFAWQRFEQTIDKFPWHLPAYCEAAKELIAMGRFAEAEERFREALQRNPNHLTALLQGGILASQQKNRELALERFERAIECYHPQKAIDAYILAATELKYLGRESEAIAKYEEILSFHQQRGLYPEVKLLGTSLTSIQELGLLLDRLATKQPGNIENGISLAKLTAEMLFDYKKIYTVSLAKDAPSLVSKFKILKELLKNSKGRDLIVLEQFNMAIDLLEKESQKLKSSEWRRSDLIPAEISLQLTDNLCFDSLSSSARYVIGNDELLEISKIQDTVKYLPGLMDREKEHFKAFIRRYSGYFKLKSRQTIDIFKNFIYEPPYGISEGYILPYPYYDNKISKQFINQSDREHTNIYGRNIAWIPDPRRFLKEIVTSKKVLDSYYEDEVVFGIPSVWVILEAYQNYGHILFDQIPSFILYQKLNLSCKIFVPHITNHHWEIFNALNIPKEKILVKQEQKFKYFITGRYQWDIEMVNFYRNLRESVVAKRGDIPSEYRYRYVYISRRYSNNRSMANEEEVEELMTSLGFSIVYGERLSFEEKAVLTNHACFVVGQNGAGFSNFIMCRQSTTIVEIFTPDFPFLYFYHIWVLGKHNCYPLLLEQKIGGWEMNIEKLKRVITAILEGE